MACVYVFKGAESFLKNPKIKQLVAVPLETLTQPPLLPQPP